jgi:hypothetical protein
VGNRATASFLVAQRQVGGSVRASDYGQLHGRFTRAQDSNPGEAAALVDDLLRLMPTSDAFRHALPLARWLIDRGDWARARRSLQRLEDALWLTYVIEGGPGVPVSLRGGPGSVGPEELVELAEQQVSAGRHERAREAFGTAWVYLQMQLVQRSDQRLQRLDELDQLPSRAASGFTVFRLFSYARTVDAVTLGRRIVGAYAVRRREAEARGDRAGAARWEALDDSLRRHLRERLVGGSIVTMEASGGTQRGRGTGYTVHGDQGGDEFVTPLPGTPRPDELGRHPAYTATVEQFLESLGGQHDFVTEVLGHAEVRDAFPTGRVDLADVRSRVRLWTALYRSFSARPRGGAPDALASTVRFLERYLRHFTTHTEYNIDDFGRTYVGRRFPRDVLGRTIADCGVYAVKVAAELQRTMRAVGRDVDFQLFLTTDHAMLAVLDRATGRHYVVSNAEIRGPLDGAPMRSMAAAYGRLMGHDEVAAIGIQGPEISGAASPERFSRTLWHHYQALGQFGLDVPRGSTRQEIYEAYYAAVRRYMRDADGLQVSLDRLSSRLAGRRTAAARASVLSAQLPGLLVVGQRLAAILDVFRTPGVAGVVRQMGVPTRGVVMVTAARRGHPLVRLAKATLLARHVGVTVDATGAALVSFVRAWDPSFASALADYVQDGHPPTL